MDAMWRPAGRGGDHMLPIEYPDATVSVIASFLAHCRTGLKA